MAPLATGGPGVEATQRCPHEPDVALQSLEGRVEAADGEEENPAAHLREKAGGKSLQHQGELIGKGQGQSERGDDREQGRRNHAGARLRNPVGDQDGPQVDCGGEKAPHRPADPVNRSIPH